MSFLAERELLRFIVEKRGNVADYWRIKKVLTI